MQIEDAIKKYDVVPNQYVLVENKGTIAERVLCACETEIEALALYRRVRTKLKTVVKANITYAEIGNVKFLYDYEEV